MKVTSFLVFLFFLSAFAIGISLVGEQDLKNVDLSIDNASNTILNITLDPATYPEVETKGILLIIEKFIHFVGVTSIEVIRIGINFGYENPDYFTSETIFKIITFIIVLMIISLLIKPVSYLLILIVLGIMWLKDRRKKEVVK